MSSPDMTYAMSVLFHDQLIDLSYLNDDERSAILEVIERDESVRRQDQVRISELSAELRALRLRGILRSGHDGTRTCARCRKPFGRMLFVNTGRVCGGCRHRVCDECRRPVDGSLGRRWLCIYCIKQKELEAMTGRWFQVATALRPPDLVPSSHVIRQSIRYSTPPPSRLHYARSVASDHITGRSAMSDFSDVDDNEDYYGGDALSLSDRNRTTPVNCSKSEHAPMKRTVSGESSDDVNSSRPAPSCHWQRSPADERAVTTSATSPSTVTNTHPAELLMLRQAVISSSGTTPISSAKQEEVFCSCEEDDDDVISAIEPTAAAAAIAMTTTVAPTSKELSVVVVNTVTSSHSSKVVEVSKLTKDQKTSGESSSTSHVQMRKKLTRAVSADERKVAHDGGPEKSHVMSVAGQSSVPAIFVTDAGGTASPLRMLSVEFSEVSSSSDTTSRGGSVTSSAKRARTRSNTSEMFSPLSSSNDSLMSTYSSAGVGTSSITPGEVEFGLAYNHKQSTLDISVKQCRHLAINENPESKKKTVASLYVKTYLLPDKSKNGKRKTKVKRNTLNPVFNEVIKYNVPRSELSHRVLRVMVWDCHRLGRNVFVGQVSVPLDNKVFVDPVPKWYKLDNNMSQERLIPAEPGRITVRIRFAYKDLNMVNKVGTRPDSQVEGQLQVIINQARGLHGILGNGLSDPFCIWSFKDPLRRRLYRSRKFSENIPDFHLHMDCNPVWNELLTFNGQTLSGLAKTHCLEITVWHADKTTGHDFLGGVRLNLGTGRSDGEPVEWMDSSTSESALWRAMIDQPDYWTEDCLPLRSTME